VDGREDAYARGPSLDVDRAERLSSPVKQGSALHSLNGAVHWHYSSERGTACQAKVSSRNRPRASAAGAAVSCSTRKGAECGSTASCRRAGVSGRSTLFGRKDARGQHTGRPQRETRKRLSAPETVGTQGRACSASSTTGKCSTAPGLPTWPDTWTAAGGGPASQSSAPRTHTGSGCGPLVTDWHARPARRAEDLRAAAPTYDRRGFPREWTRTLGGAQRPSGSGGAVRRGREAPAASRQP